ncbi:23S rRNA (pseudouridine(1915)-N(3))-methyltransferase RlmH [Ruminococcus sp. OA3]|uniref:23S rRNA (pseudouridine(1915)-N(3))-methyltransferase RlmH n=1 Tax=Ruminococcus sp. OA3 TaxID=2914164 RepID=UPI001F0637EA|nr:23S rRNA (pseudouridine(1915)-N(3))-methyltransferase RlmH [Ruminococcus sp. OA3]MCH1983378.1 23S rRNA (pseudouridine(1915)-N(3))-methyltransferase RlmH [Ruminococcus sp. OA3]
MKITCLTVGKVKEKFYTQAIAEFVKRLGKYVKLEIKEVPDEKTPDKAGEKLEVQIRDTEGLKLLRYIRDTDYVIALAIEGEMPDSVQLAGRIEQLGVCGVSHIVFVIGGSLGLGSEVLRRADYKLSFSRMTFPHQLMRVILLEQIYRCFRIINGEPYHK